jgi:hypothetical protein
VKTLNLSTVAHRKSEFSEFVTQISAAFEKYLNFSKNRSKILQSAEEPMETLFENGRNDENNPTCIAQTVFNRFVS